MGQPNFYTQTASTQANSPLPFPSPKAQPRDIAKAKVSGQAKRYWAHLCNYRNDGNRAWPKLSTSAFELFCSERTIQSYRSELLEANWICLPHGDAGGRPPNNSKNHNLVIHLHPDGQPCQLCKTQLKQRTEEANRHRAEANRRPRTNTGKGEETAPFAEPQKGEDFAPLRVKETAEKGEDFAAHIRNEPFIEPLNKKEPSTTTRARETAVPKIADVADVAVADAKLLKNCERMCDGGMLDGVGRARIRNAANRYGFTYLQLRYMWRKSPMKKTGGLILLAEEWPKRAEGIEWPACFECDDTGKILPMMKSPRAIDSVCAASCSCVLEATYDESPAATPTPKTTDPTFIGFRLLAQKAGLFAREEDWEHIRRLFWTGLNYQEKEAAAQGIIDRESTEWRDPAMRPGAMKYVCDQLWTYPVKSESEVRDYLAKIENMMRPRKQKTDSEYFAFIDNAIAQPRPEQRNDCPF